MASRRFRPSARWAMGNKRQKKKIERWYESACGCSWCCPEDRREKIRARDLRREAA